MYTFTTTCVAPVFTRHVLNTFHNGSFERSEFYFVVLLIIEAFALETIEGDVRNQLHLTPNGSYVARLQAPGYKPVDIPVMTEGRMLHPKEDTPLPDNVYGEYNLIGVRLESETPLR